MVIALEETDTAKINIKTNPWGFEQNRLSDYVVASQFPIDVGFTMEELNVICTEEDDVRGFLRLEKSGQ